MDPQRAAPIPQSPFDEITNARRDLERATSELVSTVGHLTGDFPPPNGTQADGAAVRAAPIPRLSDEAAALRMQASLIGVATTSLRRTMPKGEDYALGKIAVDRDIVGMADGALVGGKHYGAHR